MSNQMMQTNLIKNKKVLLHACCAICSGYPISLLKDMGYLVSVYFYNPNIYPIDEYNRRLDAEKTLCDYSDVNLVVGNYETDAFYRCAEGLEQEPEKGKRCVKCFELRLRKTAEFAKESGYEYFTTSIVISPHKNFQMISEIGERIAKEYGLTYLSIDFKKKDGFLKTNKLSKELGLYRQNYCGCEFSIVKKEEA
ncbi:MAG: epoxyqueuosine reductase QueH [Candidatus Gastranaerophilaceae bacterium]|nr:epoxyqueuosine reductase QueH [Candidatus Gastranaerophilaceae bacterium]